MGAAMVDACAALMLGLSCGALGLALRGRQLLVLDDIEGFYNNCIGSECIEDLKKCRDFYIAQLRKRDRRKKGCYVSRHKTKPVLPGNVPKMKLDSSYTLIT